MDEYKLSAKLGKWINSQFSKNIWVYNDIAIA